MPATSRSGKSEADAIRLAQSAAVKAIGVIAFALDVDGEGNATGEPRLLTSIGTVPDVQF